MESNKEEVFRILISKGIVSDTDFQGWKAYQKLAFFSLHNELRMLLYLSVLLFTSGMGILVYQNIDSIGHLAILSLLFVVTLVCFFYSFKNSSGFTKELATFQNPVFDYLVLAAALLSCLFIGYLQFQYQPFGRYYGLATLVPTLLCFFCAYYFDNKSVLSVAITGFASYIGLTVDPKSLLSSATYVTTALSYSGIALGVVFILFTLYATKIELKKHFNFIYLMFAIHLISIACITNLFEDLWWIFALVLGISTYYYIKVSGQIRSVSLFVFALLYGYIGFNCVIVKIMDALNLFDMASFFIVLAPIYFVLSIVGFIRLIRNFNKTTSDDSIR